jgi:hypothetical protein
MTASSVVDEFHGLSRPRLPLTLFGNGGSRLPNLVRFGRIICLALKRGEKDINKSVPLLLLPSWGLQILIECFVGQRDAN